MQTSQKNLNFPTKFRKSSSPARKWPNGSPGRQHIQAPNKLVGMPSSQYGTTAALKRSPNDIRRSSAAGITHQRPPLPPNTIGKRSQSLDGLLDTANNTCTTNNINTEGASDDTPNTLTIPDNQTSSDTTDSISPAPTKNHRRSRSLEDLLDERDEIHLNYDSHSKSMDSSIDTLSLTTEPCTERIKDDVTTISEPIDKTDASSIGSASSLNPSQTEKSCGCETITVENTIPQPSETDSSVASVVDDDRVSNLTEYSRQGSTTSKDSDSKKKTFLNRYVKKVKSFIKK